MSQKEHTTGTSRDREHWSEISEAGTVAGIYFLFAVYRIFGRWLFTLALFPGIVYFMLRRRVARLASLDFLKTHHRRNPQFWRRSPGYRDVLKHFMAFGHGALDKVLAWGSKIHHDEFVLPNKDAVHQLLTDPRGHLIIGSHLGNLEYCRGYMTRYHNTNVNILVYERHGANFAAIKERLSPESKMNVYQVDDLDLKLILLLKTKVERGEWLFIAGDRVPVTGYFRTTTVDFMGRRAYFPIGPYLLAHSLGCPVWMMFSYRHEGKVVLEVESLDDKVSLTRGQRDLAINGYAQKFASALEDRCDRVPLQWFNFYDIWGKPPLKNRAEQ